VPLPPVVGSYQPLLELASGGMATVYAVRQVGAHGFERIVVMKRVHPHLVSNREFHDMFIDEARLSSLVKHPNIVAVIDVAEEAGELFLIMEYVESVSLAQLLRTLQGELLSAPVVSRIICDVLAGLHAAHEALDLRGNAMSIIHRDVSPQNIIVGVDGTSRLIDFGIAKASSRLTPTTSGMLKGKFGYMAPEQIRQQALDRRVDVFAAGVVLHEALTSTRLFAAGDEADALLGVLVREVPDPSSRVPGLPSEMDAVVHRALARDRDERFSTAGEFAAAIEAVCPPVSPREIASLVARVCSDTLSERRRKLQAAFERPTANAAVTNPVPVEVPIDGPADYATARRRRVLVGVGALAVAVGVSALAFTFARTPPLAAPAAQPRPTPPPIATTVTADPAPSTAPATSAAPTEVPSSSSKPIPSAPPRPPPSVKPAARPPHPKSDIHKSNPYLDP
jgi:eukaryotic-like serine/threonine-protein kinase